MLFNQQWIVDLNNYIPNIEGHWPAYCVGFNLSLTGKIWLSDNKEIFIDTPNAKGFTYPCHRDLIAGEGEDETLYSGLYCWKDNKPSLWLYPHAERVFNEKMLTGLKTLIGVHLITEETKLFSNTWRHEISTLSSEHIHCRSVA